MKRIFTFIVALIVVLGIKAQGWPANYNGVMLQGFYWDSYQETNWNTLEANAEELSQYFDLIWVPNSGMTSGYYHDNTSYSNGYDPCFWLNHTSCFGTEAQLRSMIQTFANKGVGIIEDVVINHKNGLTGWTDFVNESVTGQNTGVTYTINWDNVGNTAICSNDEAAYNGYLCGGAADTGDNFDGYRDLDHTNATVQQNVITYLDFLLNELGYSGFRYDMVKGFGANYVAMYNTAAKPTYSVGEYWDTSYDNLTGWISGTGYASAAFDFPLQGVMQDVFKNGNWSALSNKGVAGDPNMSPYVVTFVDNHDTYRNDNRITSNVLAANAFILAMPGTPCIFWPHWTAYKEELKKMIEARKEAGITNQSKILVGQEYDGGYVTIVQGENKNILVISGYPQGVDLTGYELVSSGTAENPNYAFYISTSENKEITVYVKADNAPYLYVWEESGNQLNGGWPGTLMTRRCLVGDEPYYYATFNTSAGALNCICNDGNGNQTADLKGFTDDVFLTYDGSSGTTNVTEQEKDKEITPISDVTYTDDEICAFFEAPQPWTNVKCWAWNNTDNYTGGSWPGQQCEIVGQTAEGLNIWKWTYTGSLTTMPTGIIFNNGASENTQQTADFTFTNGGYYTTTGKTGMGFNTSALFDREFVKDQRNTICLPINLSESDMQQVDGTAYELTSFENGYLTFTAVSSIEAYKPYIFIANTTGKCFQPFTNHQLVEGKPIEVKAGDYTFVGTVERIHLVSNNKVVYYGYKASDGTFVKVGTGGGANISAYRCYFTIPAASDNAAPQALFQESTDGIASLRMFDTTTDSPVYTIDGRVADVNGRTDRLPRGVYIQNNHKIVIK